MLFRHESRLKFVLPRRPDAPALPVVFSMGRKKFTQIPKRVFPESLSVSVNTNEEASLRAVLRGPTEEHPSGWQKYTISKGKGKSLWSWIGYRRSNSGA